MLQVRDHRPGAAPLLLGLARKHAWPQNLVVCALLNALHAEADDNGIGMYGRTYKPGSKGMLWYKFFVITMAASFVFFFLPGMLCKCSIYLNK